MDRKNENRGGYEQIMEHISVTPEMEERIVGNLHKEAANNTKVKKYPYTRWMAGLAACAAAIVLCLALVPMMRAQTQQPEEFVGVPLPPQRYETIEEALAVLPFSACIPAALPQGYELAECTVYSGEMLELTYTNGENQIRFRTAQGNEDISGDYNAYAITNSICADHGASVWLKGDANGYQAAIWTAGETAYSISSTAPLPESDMRTIINSIHNPSAQ